MKCPSALQLTSSVSCFSWPCSRGGARSPPSQSGGQWQPVQQPAKLELCLCSQRGGVALCSALQRWWTSRGELCWPFVVLLWSMEENCWLLWRCKDAPGTHSSQGSLRSVTVHAHNITEIPPGSAVASYLGGTFDGFSGICKIIVCLFFTHWF